jgi:hypothetical protein
MVHAMLCAMLWQHLITGSGSVFGMRIKIQEHGNLPELTNKPGFLPLKKALNRTFAGTVCFLTYFLYQIYFICWNSTFCDFRVWQGSGSGSELTNKPGFLPIKKALYIHKCVFWPITFFKYIFHVPVTIQLLWLQSLTRIRIYIYQNNK